MENKVEPPSPITNMVFRNSYPDDYKNTVFYIWYITGKPRRGKLKQLIPENAEGRIPEDHTISLWEKDFHQRAIEIDRLVNEELEKATVKEKVAMLEKHAELAIEMQEIAMNYLRVNKEKLNPHSAVRLLVDGIRVERESRGLSSLIIDIANADNEELMKMLEEALNKSEITFNELDIIDAEPEELEDGIDDEQELPYLQ